MTAGTRNATLQGGDEAPPPHEPRLTFYVSADLESVGLLVRWSHGAWQSQKAYNRALLVLARARQRDAESLALNPHEHGWMYADQICELADYDGVNRLNVEIHRARSDFAAYGIPGGNGLVERRRGTGQLRLGFGQVTIVEAFVDQGTPCDRRSA